MGRSVRALSELSQGMFRLGEANVHHDTVINTILYFDDAPSVQEMRKRAEEVFGANWKFRASVEKKNGLARWKVSEKLENIEQHVVETELPTEHEFADQQDLYQYIANTYGREFPFDRPLWSIEVITNLRNAGPEGKSNGALLVRLHHLIGDGISLVAFSMRIFDNYEDLMQDSGSSKGSKRQSSKRKSKKRSKKVEMFDIHPALQFLHGARVFLGGIVQGVLGTVIPGDEHTVLKRRDINKVGGRTIVASDLVDLDKVKDIKDAVGGTVNDVLIAALAGVFRSYLKAEKEKIPKGQVRCACLINMRNADEMKRLLGKEMELSNRFNFLPLPLPVSLSDPLDRLYKSKTTCDDAKISPQPLVTYRLNMLAQKYAPKEALQATYDVFSKWTTVFTNVPGPGTEQKVCGKPVQGINVFANSLCATAFSILSYNGKMQLQMVSDSSMKNPQNLVDGFPKEIDVLYEATRADRLRKPKISMADFIFDGAIVMVVFAMVLNILWSFFL